MASEFLQHVNTPLNACSLETLPSPVQLEDGEWVWPLMLGCYELDESLGERRGHLDLYAVPVPDTNEAVTPSLGNPINIFGTQRPASGILDGKWCPTQNDTDQSKTFYYATAHATGELQIHQVACGTSESSDPLTVRQVCQSEESDSGLCLALSWDPSDSGSSRRIISSYSNGQVAIHQVAFPTTGSADGDASVEELQSWSAHKMFNCPAEVWSASFTTNPDVVLSGGDEGQLKIWDLRVGTTAALHTLKHFEAGVTVLSPHPRRDHLVACGSYDETMALLDLRKVSESKPAPVYHSQPLGGGLWRMKWHPMDDDRLLLGVMHGGCRVVQLSGLDDASERMVQVQQEFTEHKSMAYGADWLAHRPKAQDRIEMAASCSFYDRALYLWNVNSKNC